jgi:hypothetical protein
LEGWSYLRKTPEGLIFKFEISSQREKVEVSCDNIKTYWTFFQQNRQGVFIVAKSIPSEGFFDVSETFTPWVDFTNI